MERIITQTASHYNNNFSSSTVVRNGTIHPRSNWLPKPLFTKLKATHHELAKTIIEKHQYKLTTRHLLHALINNCDKHGVTRVSQRYLAYELKVSTKTIERHMARLVADGVIDYRKNGYLISNTTILLFIQPELPSETDKMSDNLNPSEAPPKGTPHEGGKEQEKKRSESLAGALPSQEEDIFEDFIPMSEDFVKEQIRKMKESLKICRYEVN